MQGVRTGLEAGDGGWEFALCRGRLFFGFMSLNFASLRCVNVGRYFNSDD